MSRNSKLTIRLSEEEERTVEKQAIWVNMSKSEFARAKLLGEEISGSLAKTNIAKHLIHVQNLFSSIGSDREKNKEICANMRKEVDQAWQYLK